MDEPIRERMPSDAPAPPSSTDAAEAFAGYLDELERLCHAATPGPWTSHQGSIWSASSRNPICDIDAGSPDEYDPDARFIEAARHALPKLIAKVRELQAELDSSATAVKGGDPQLQRELAKLYGFDPSFGLDDERGVAGDRCEVGNECGRLGCPECQQ
jgi:hypothetical protein